ncbi:MAG: shikimate kinase [Lactobacillales bacterium]|jgi:shikimate kinase|nr:shikimate kinase [Lactobacillales bacterium]
MERIILIGFMGAGKTTISAKLGQRLHLPVVDLDEFISKKISGTIADYFEKYGEASFRYLETECLQELLKQKIILSTGGGIVVSSENRKLLSQEENVVYLETSPKLFLERIRNDKENNRPLANEKSDAEVVALFQSRETYYKEAMSFSVATDTKSPQEIVDEIIMQQKGRKS